MRTLRTIKFWRHRVLYRLVGLSVFLVSGCAYVSTYNPAYLPSEQGSSREVLPGKGLVYTEKADDLYLFAGSPTSFTARATTLTIPLGAITKEIAITVFHGVFKDGVDSTNKLDMLSPYRAVIRPKITHFTYQYNQAKNLGFAITPTVQTSLEVKLLNKDGQPYWEKSYNSGVQEGAAYVISGSPGEEISKLTHRVIYTLMTQAAADVGSVIKSQSEK